MQNIQTNSKRKNMTTNSTKINVDKYASTDKTAVATILSSVKSNKKI